MTELPYTTLGIDHKYSELPTLRDRKDDIYHQSVYKIESSNPDYLIGLFKKVIEDHRDKIISSIHAEIISLVVNYVEKSEIGE